jgi:hypothetical protein
MPGCLGHTVNGMRAPGRFLTTTVGPITSPPKPPAFPQPGGRKPKQQQEDHPGMVKESSTADPTVPFLTNDRGDCASSPLMSPIGTQ